MSLKRGKGEWCVSLKIELQPIPNRERGFSSGKRKWDILASNDEFTELILKSTKKWKGFAEITGQFRIYREKDTVMLELIRNSEILDSVDEELFD